MSICPDKYFFDKHHEMNKCIDEHFPDENVRQRNELTNKCVDEQLSGYTNVPANTFGTEICKMNICETKKCTEKCG